MVALMNASPCLSQPLPMLTSAAAVHNLTQAEASRGYPVQMRLTALSFVPRYSSLFAQDGDTGIYVQLEPEQATLPIHPGTLLTVSGVTGPGNFMSIIEHPTVRILGQGRLPAARPVSIEKLSTGVENCQWVEIELSRWKSSARHPIRSCCRCGPWTRSGPTPRVLVSTSQCMFAAWSQRCGPVRPCSSETGGRASVFP